MKTNIKHTALLSRLSREDENNGTSESILTQKAMLSQYAQKHHFKNIIHYVDDGYSGTNFERPDFQRLMQDIKLGKIGIVITKDLSRLGRDYLKTGYLLEDFFPSNNVRFIAINDNIDSYGDPTSVNNVIVPFKNLINDEYCRDISNKIRSVLTMKKRRGEYVAAFTPYGYIKDPKDNHHLIIDEEAARVVKMIYRWSLEGCGRKKIAKKLNVNQTTIARWEDKGGEPTISSVFKIAKYFEISIDDLITIDLTNKEVE